MRIESRLDENWSCKCSVQSTDGALRGSVVVEVLACRAHQRQREGLHPRQGWLAHTSANVRRCAQLETALHGMHVLAADPSVLTERGPERRTCWHVALTQEHERARGGLHLFDRLTASGVPKAVLAVELKHAVMSMGAAGDALEEAHDRALVAVSYARGRVARMDAAHVSCYCVCATCVCYTCVLRTCAMRVCYVRVLYVCVTYVCYACVLRACAMRVLMYKLVHVFE